MTTTPQWITVLSALLVPTAAILAIIVAVRQADIASKKLKLDLFEKRFVVFSAAKDALSHIVTNHRLVPEARQAYVVGTRGAQFLFNDEIHRYLNESLLPDMDRYTDLTARWGQMENREKQQVMEIRNELGGKLARALHDVDGKFATFLRLEDSD